MLQFVTLLKRIISWALERPDRVLATLLCLLIVVAVAYHYRTVSALESENTDIRNQLANAIGTIEISDGVYARQGIEIRNLNDRLEDLLGENTRLTELVDDRDTQVTALFQANATLTERLRFTSRGQNNQPTVEIIQNENCRNGESDAEGVETDWVPNIKIEYSIEQDGWLVDVLAYTNPALVEVELTQTVPYYLDGLVTISPDGTPYLNLSEQNGRLQFEISEFAVDDQRRKERWFELFGIGITTAWTPSNPQLGLALQVETRNRLDFSIGPLWNLRTGETGAHATLAFRPFKRRQ